jgi:NADH:ubiquinone reductase (H+-translocating)
MEAHPQAAVLPHVVVVGAGFAGLNFVREFPPELAAITMIDVQNHHLFQPLLYQVATAGLSAIDIAQPVRGVFGARPNFRVLMSKVTDIDLAERRVKHERGVLTFDTLVLAAGATTSYFGKPDWEKHAPGLKTIDDSLRIRRRILCALERAETESDPSRRASAMTIVVVGGGPTGVELAGAFAELTRTVLHRDFDHIDPKQVKVLLIQGDSRVLPSFPAELSASAQRQLERLGVEVRTGLRVESIRDGELTAGGEVMRADNIIWAAGVAASPLAKALGVELDRGGRVRVLPDLSVPGHPVVFVLGDMAVLTDVNGVEVPGVAQAAIQMGRHTARVLERELREGRREPGDREAFAYRDKGSMATIGRSAAVARLGKLKLKGYPAWLAWLAVHLLFLVGFRSKLFVLLHWIYSYFTYRRGARIITGLGGDDSA